MKAMIQLLLSLTLVTGCTPFVNRSSAVRCTRQFLYTEYTYPRDGTLETRPVYGCAPITQTVVTTAPAGNNHE
jgi:hypothetical protein